MTDAPSRPRGRWTRRPVVIVVGSVLLGMVLGALLTGFVVRQRLGAIQSMFEEEGFEAVFFEATDPTPEQREQVRPILRDAYGVMIASTVDFRSRMRAHADSTLDALDVHLDDEQMERARFLLKVLPERQFRERMDSLPAEASGR